MPFSKQEQKYNRTHFFSINPPWILSQLKWSLFKFYFELFWFVKDKNHCYPNPRIFSAAVLQQFTLKLSENIHKISNLNNTSCANHSVLFILYWDKENRSLAKYLVSLFLIKYYSNYILLRTFWQLCVHW